MKAQGYRNPRLRAACPVLSRVAYSGWRRSCAFTLEAQAVSLPQQFALQIAMGKKTSSPQASMPKKRQGAPSPSMDNMGPALKSARLASGSAPPQDSNVHLTILEFCTEARTYNEKFGEGRLLELVLESSARPSPIFGQMTLERAFAESHANAPKDLDEVFFDVVGGGVDRFAAVEGDGCEGDFDGRGET